MKENRQNSELDHDEVLVNSLRVFGVRFLGPTPSQSEMPSGLLRDGASNAADPTWSGPYAVGADSLTHSQSRSGGGSSESGSATTQLVGQRAPGSLHRRSLSPVFLAHSPELFILGTSRPFLTCIPKACNCHRARNGMGKSACVLWRPGIAASPHFPATVWRRR